MFLFIEAFLRFWLRHYGRYLVEKDITDFKELTDGTIYQNMSCLIFTEEVDKIVGGLEWGMLDIKFGCMFFSKNMSMHVCVYVCVCTCVCVYICTHTDTSTHPRAVKVDPEYGACVVKFYLFIDGWQVVCFFFNWSIIALQCCVSLKAASH